MTTVIMGITIHEFSWAIRTALRRNLLTRSSLVIVFIWRNEIKLSTLVSPATSARGLNLATWISICDNRQKSHDLYPDHKIELWLIEYAPDYVVDRSDGIAYAPGMERTLAGTGSSFAGVW